MQPSLRLCALVVLVAGAIVPLGLALGQQTAPAKVLPGTEPLELQGDITSQLVDGVDRFLLKQLEQAPAARQQHWPSLIHKDATQPHALIGELSTMIGLRDERTPNPRLTLEHAPGTRTPYAASTTWYAEQARWPVHSGVDATGLYVVSSQMAPNFRAIIIPDASQTPEQLIGLGEGNERVMDWAAQLAAIGGELLVTTPVSRTREARRGRAIMTDQEFLYRSALN